MKIYNLLNRVLLIPFLLLTTQLIYSQVPNADMVTPNYPVYAIAIDGNFTYIGGDFTSVGGIERNGIAKINNLTGQVEENWDAGLSTNDIVETIAVYGNSIYVGGEFSFIGGRERLRLAKLNKIDGQADSLWNPSDGGYFYTILPTSEGVYVGGYFYEIGGEQRYGLAKLDDTYGYADSTWNPNLNEYVHIYTLAIDNDAIYFGGWALFDVGEYNRKGIAKINRYNALLDSSWNADLVGINSNLKLTTFPSEN